MNNTNMSDERIKKKVDDAYRVGEGMKNLNFWQRNKRKIIVGGSAIAITVAALYFSGKEGTGLAVDYGKEKGKKQAADIYNPQLLQKEQEKLAALGRARADSARADSALAKARADSLSAVSSKKDTEKATKERNAAIAHAQKTTREAETRERETILSMSEQYASQYPGFKLMIDYIVEERSFQAKPLPWKKISLDNKEFMKYATNPAKNIQDFLMIKELGEKGLVPRTSVEAFLNGKYDEYKGDILGQDVRALYHSNASDGKIYGVKLQNGKVIGLDELARQNVTYTGPSKEEIKQKIGKMNIPNGWRKMQSYQKK